MHGNPTRHRRAFTLTELLTVVGLISLLVSLLMPLVTKVRTAADATACLSTLRQMGAAWTMYTVENRGRLPHYVSLGTSPTPDAAWYGYWTGILDKYEVRGDSILCAAAAEEVETGSNRGFGNVGRAWSGKYSPSGSALRFNNMTHRASSYGYNGYLVAGKPYGFGSCVGGVKPASDVPAFFDCAYADALPYNYPESSLVSPPPNLRGDQLGMSSADHWRFLLARHGRGINVCMADGSARWVRLEETYTLTWHQGWVSYRLQLPTK
ncbi:MAG TPA: type II secretion system protein [Tepidisphaeraceae bacterium]|nr:type II secretion system protein [Tepidisphaeraceae bacterium]